MHLIAICDDETEELNKTEQLLLDYGDKHPDHVFTIKRFENVNDLLQVIKDKSYMPDLLLLDIYMPEMLGTAAAKELRDMGSAGRIIFLTSSSEHALDAFRVDALQYLVKPIEKADLFAAIDKYLQTAKDKRKKHLLLKIDGMIQRIPLADIVSLEAQGKRQCLHMADGSHAILHMTMTALYQMLSHYEEFVKVGAAYIINLEHIDSLNSHNACLDTGKNIFLPRGAYQPLKEQYFRYYCETDNHSAE